MAGVFIARDYKKIHRGKTIQRYRENTATYEPRRRASGETNPADTLTLDVQLQGCEKINARWVSPAQPVRLHHVANYYFSSSSSCSEECGQVQILPQPLSSAVTLSKWLRFSMQNACDATRSAWLFWELNAARNFNALYFYNNNFV